MEREYESIAEAEKWASDLENDLYILRLLKESLSKVQSDIAAEVLLSDHAQEQVDEGLELLGSVQADYLDAAERILKDEIAGAHGHAESASEEVERGMANFRSTGV